MQVAQQLQLIENISNLDYSVHNATRPEAEHHVWQPPWTGGLAPKLQDARRTRFLEDILEGQDDAYWVQEKLDGVMLAFTGAYALTKAGNEYEGIPKDFRRWALPQGIPLIGELYHGPGWTNHGLASVSRLPLATVARLDGKRKRGTAAETAARSADSKHASKWYYSKYVVFDIPGLTMKPYSERYELMKKAVMTWNNGIAEAHNLKDVNDLPLQCVRNYNSADWQHLLKEVMLQPVLRARPPWVTEGDLPLRMAHHAMTHTDAAEFSPAGEGLVFHRKDASWLDRNNKAQKGPPAGVKLKPRILMPARVVSEVPRLWGQRGGRDSFGYLITVEYWHPGMRKVAQTSALIPDSQKKNHNTMTITQTYRYGQIVFLTSLGVVFNKQSMRAHSIASASLQSWHMAAIIKTVLRNPKIIGLSEPERTRLLQMLGRDTDGTPIATASPAILREELIAWMCKSSTALPLHPIPENFDWCFQRLLYTDTTSRHVKLRHLRVPQNFVNHVSIHTHPEYIGNLAPGGPPRGAPPDRSSSAPVSLVPNNWIQQRTHIFSQIIIKTATFVENNGDTSTFLKPICHVNDGSRGALAQGLVSRWCNVTCGGSEGLPPHDQYIRLCQGILLTCFARVWADLEGNIGDTNVGTSFLRGRVEQSVNKVVTIWNTAIHTIDRAHDLFTVDGKCSRGSARASCYGTLDALIDAFVGAGLSRGGRFGSASEWAWTLTPAEVQKFIYIPTTPAAAAQFRIPQDTMLKLLQWSVSRGSEVPEGLRLLDLLPLPPVVRPCQERVDDHDQIADGGILQQLISLNKMH